MPRSDACCISAAFSECLVPRRLDLFVGWDAGRNDQRIGDLVFGSFNRGAQGADASWITFDERDAFQTFAMLFECPAQRLGNAAQPGQNRVGHGQIAATAANQHGQQVTFAQLSQRPAEFTGQHGQFGRSEAAGQPHPGNGDQPLGGWVARIHKQKRLT